MTWQPYSECPCGCGVIAWKLKRNGHGVGCKCRSCIGKRNRVKGQAAEARRHRQLGGTGMTPRDELPHVYPLSVTIEDKTGDQIPAKFVSFADSAWFEHAMQQARKKIPVGVDALPTVRLELSPSRAYLVTEWRKERG